MLRVSQSLVLLMVAAVIAQSNDEDDINQQGAEGSGDIIKVVHGIVAVLAWVIFFPLGATLIRVINSSKTWWIHASIQILAIILMIATAVSGILILEKDQVCL